MNWDEEKWESTPVVIIDTETTGVGKNDAVCEFSGIIAVNGEIEQVFTTYINPMVPIKMDAYAVHGISDDDVRDAPYIEDVADKILELLHTGFPIVAHGLAFDVRMLRYCPDIAEQWPTGVPTLCTLDYVRYRNPKTKDLPSFKLPSVSTMFGLYKEQKNMHRAEADCRALAELLPKLMRGQTVAKTMTKLSDQWVK